jgi:hypothetical protein
MIDDEEEEKATPLEDLILVNLLVTRITSMVESVTLINIMFAIKNEKRMSIPIIR